MGGKTRIHRYSTEFCGNVAKQVARFTVPQDSLLEEQTKIQGSQDIISIFVVKFVKKIIFHTSPHEFIRLISSNGNCVANM